MTVMAETSWEQFTLPWAEPELEAGPVESMIERVPSDFRISIRLGEYKDLARQGWAVSALLAPDSKTMVLIACRGESVLRSHCDRGHRLDADGRCGCRKERA